MFVLQWASSEVQQQAACVVHFLSSSLGCLSHRPTRCITPATRSTMASLLPLQLRLSRSLVRLYPSMSASATTSLFLSQRHTMHCLPSARIVAATLKPKSAALAFQPNSSSLLGPVQLMNKLIVRNAHKPPLTYDFIRERILLVLRLYDKIDPDKLTLDSHFYNDLGLDSLDHVEVIMSIEDEFLFEIPDVDAEKLNTPREILKYISIKEEIYPELEHHDDHDHAHH